MLRQRSRRSWKSRRMEPKAWQAAGCSSQPPRCCQLRWQSCGSWHSQAAAHAGKALGRKSRRPRHFIFIFFFHFLGRPSDTSLFLPLVFPLFRGTPQTSHFLFHFFVYIFGRAPAASLFFRFFGRPGKFTRGDLHFWWPTSPKVTFFLLLFFSLFCRATASEYVFFPLFWRHTAPKSYLFLLFWPIHFLFYIFGRRPAESLFSTFFVTFSGGHGNSHVERLHFWWPACPKSLFFF